MKSANGFMRTRTQSIITLILLLISIPIQMHGQINHKDIVILLTCVEDLGNGQHLAYFGYENPNAYVVNVAKKDSYLQFNGEKKKTFVLNEFQSGLYERAFSMAFDSDGQVLWHVRTNTYEEKEVVANNSSELCPAQLNIIPGYYPPEGGKEYNSKIGAELTALYEAYGYDPDVPDAPEEIFQLEGTMVLIEVVANQFEFDAMIESLLALGDPGFEQVTSDPDVLRATGWVEISDLLRLNEMDPLHHARPVYPGVGNYTVLRTGVVQSQGDFAMHSDFARLGYEIDGKGVKIGVLSNSFNSKGLADLDVSNGDLPGGSIKYPTSVDVLKDITNRQLSDEGRAMLQIIHDIAPGAELAFRTGYLGEQDMADGIRELAGEADCDIIVDDLSYITEPFFADGVISQAITEVVGDGVTFFSSAGNFGNASFTDVFSPAPAPPSIIGFAHAFDGEEDIFQEVELPEGNYTLVLQWDDGIDASMMTTQTDLDIFLSDDTGFSLLGFNRENVDGFPIEVVPFSVIGETVQANVVIAMASEPTGAVVTFKYILFRGGSLFKILGDEVGSSTIVGHPNAAGAITVGAVRFDKNPVYNSLYTIPEIMSFSSVGGTPMINEGPREKPDFTAPNGVNTMVDLGNGDWDSSLPPDNDPTIDPDEYANFFGTSAASPHAAGMAALLIQAGLKFQSDTPFPPSEIRRLMKDYAIPMNNPYESGYNYEAGSGFIQAHKSIMEFANPKPYVENLILISEGGVDGEEITPASFTLEGDFFTEDTRVLFRGDELTADMVDFENESTIQVEHPPFLGNPEIQAYNEPKSISKDDGGKSDIKYFTDPVKRKIYIHANSYTIKYGEQIPVYEGTVLVEIEDGDPIPLAQAVFEELVLEEEAVRLSGLSFEGTTAANPVAGIHNIIPSLDPLIDLENPENELDLAISQKYILEYPNGTLTIEKLAIIVTPDDVDLVYGMQLPGDRFTYSYEVEDPDFIGDPNLIELAAIAEHNEALINEVALVRGIALVNGIPMIRGIALVNGVPLIRGIALVNGVEVEVDLDGDVYVAGEPVYVAGEPVGSGGPLIRGIALVNGLPFVNMTQIVRGVALVNGSELNFADGYMSLDDDPMTSGIPVVRGVALVNGEATVGDVTVSRIGGKTYIGTDEAPTTGIIEINGIPVVRGIALVNSSDITLGTALVNGVDVPIENGLPKVRGIALVNGIPFRTGTALVNDLRIVLNDGQYQEVWKGEDNLVNSLNFARGIALVNDVPLVNYTDANIDLAIENGIAVINEEAPGISDVLVNMDNMNTMATEKALVNNLKNVRGIALVNDIEDVNGNEIEGVDGKELEKAAEYVPKDDVVVIQNVSLSRGLALVNGLAYVRGIALVNNVDPIISGIPFVNGPEVKDDSVQGTIMVFDFLDVGTSVDDVEMSPMSFITGTTAGQHWIIPGTFISNNFEISYGLGTLTIKPAPVTVTLTAQDKDYDGTPTATILMTDNLPDDANADISYKSASFENNHVGEDKPVSIHGLAMTGPDADNFNMQALTLPVADINPRPLTVTMVPEILYINEGDPLPTEIVFNYEGMVPGESFICPYTVLRDDGASYDMHSDESAGRYTITPELCDNNYSYQDPAYGLLYVNPFGPGTRAIKPVLNCIEDKGDYFVANFEYKNDNDAAVYIPAGDSDNLLTGSGIVWPDDQVQPSIFEVEGGSFYVHFDGSALSWIVNSLDEDHKASSAANANSSSTKCNTNTKSAAVAAAIVEEELDPDYLLVYPNPVIDKVHITMKDIEHYKMIMMYDIAGSSHSITSIDKRTDNLEIDMAQLKSGYYIIKIVMEDTTRVVQVIKE